MSNDIVLGLEVPMRVWLMCDSHSRLLNDSRRDIDRQALYRRLPHGRDNILQRLDGPVQ